MSSINSNLNCSTNALSNAQNIHSLSIVKEVKIIHQNIRSMRTNFDVFLINLSQLMFKPTVIVLTEIWISESELSLYKISGFKMFAKCTDYSRAKGLLVYVLEEIPCNSISVTLSSADCVLLTLHFGFINFYLLCLYRHHVIQPNHFLNEIQGVFHKVSGNLVIVGDININILDNNQVSNDYINLMCSQGLQCLLKLPTRITRSSSTCLDHVFARIANMYKFQLLTEVLHLDISDHSMTVFSIAPVHYHSQNRGGCESEPLKYGINYNYLKHCVAGVDWTVVFNENNASKAFELIIEKLTSCLEFSRFSYSTTKDSKKLKPWMTNSPSSA
ncbi:uncharacterized protein LOC124170906 [Ischnura elegans]|uniref:uncharacterized protein LOC124170906 n=1 Tax=Ischnura elegans TaxID=197161 RepID=UPI001ED8B6F7|nr:uncharacterized protein LOC124170906 [Ischnura elegans]